MDTIFCLVGPSGSGKTTVAKALDYNVIQSYTTRPQRSEDEWGHTFVEAYKDTGDTIAYNKYNNYEYWATKAQYQGKGKTIYIIDPKGDAMLRETIDEPVVTIFLKVSEAKAFNRMCKERNYIHAQERLEYDREEFAKVRADWVVNADRPVAEVVADVKSIMDSW